MFRIIFVIRPNINSNIISFNNHSLLDCYILTNQSNSRCNLIFYSFNFDKSFTLIWFVSTIRVPRAVLSRDCCVYLKNNYFNHDFDNFPLVVSIKYPIACQAVDWIHQFLQLVLFHNSILEEQLYFQLSFHRLIPRLLL